MLAVAPQDTELCFDLLPSMGTDELRGEFARVLGLTARNLVYLAAVWKELESRGVDLSGLRSGLIAYLPHIASGAVSPEAVVRFAGSPPMLRAITSLPLDQQRRLAEGEPVKLVVKQGDAFTHRMLPAHALTQPQVKLVFGERRMRSEAEQIAILTRPPIEAVPRKPVLKGQVVVDRMAGTVRIGRNIVPASDVIDALRTAGLVK